MKRGARIQLVLLLAVMLFDGAVGAPATGVFAYGQSEVKQTIPEINLSCSNTPLKMSLDPTTWDQAFANAKKINLVITPGYKDYKYAGSSDYAAVRVMCDPNKIYFLAEYVIPSDSGSVSYKPVGLVVYIDTVNNKNLVPQKEDYKFEIHPSGAVGFGITHGLFYREGTGDFNKGYNGWGKYTMISDVAFGREGDSKMSTSIFQQPHPVMYFDLTKSSINIQNPFGLGFWIWDGYTVSKVSGDYFAIYPVSSGFDYQSASWASVYSLYQSPVTTTTQITSTSTQLSNSSNSANSLSTGGTNETTPFYSISSAGIEWLVVVALSLFLAASGLLGLRRYRHRKK